MPVLLKIVLVVTFSFTIEEKFTKPSSVQFVQYFQLSNKATTFLSGYALLLYAPKLNALLEKYLILRFIVLLLPESS